jgi:hypothetical protein
MIVTTENTEPTIKETQPLVENAKPLVENDKPLVENTKPLVKETKPDPIDPKKKLDKSKAKKWVIDLYKSNGKEIDDASATSFAEHKNIKLMMKNQYRKAKGVGLAKSAIDKLYSSWEIEIDPVDEVLQNSTLYTDSRAVRAGFENQDEKKNPNGTSNTGLQSNSEDGSSSLDYKGFFNGDKTYSDNINAIPLSVLNLPSEDAILVLNNTLKEYGVNVTKGSEDTSIRSGFTITRPDGKSESFTLFSDSYKASLKIVNPGQNPDDLQKVRHSQMLSFINGSRDNNLSYKVDILRDTDVEGLPSAIKGFMNGALTPSSEDMSFVLGLLPPNARKMADYFNGDGSFNTGLWKFDVLRANNGLNKEKRYQADEDQYIEGTNKVKDNTAIKNIKVPFFPNIDSTKKINKQGESRNRRRGLAKIRLLSESFNKKRQIASANLGDALRSSGAYRKVDISDPEAVSRVREAGLLPGDLPMQQILINGKPSTYNEVSTMLYDYNTVKAIRAGKITINIGDPKTAGVLASQVAELKDLIRTQEAYDNEGILGYDNGMTDWLNQAQETIEGIGTEVGLSTWELASNIGYIGYDSLVGLGVPEEAAQQIMYGSIGLPGIGNFKKLLDPEFVRQTRKEWQPVYGGDILSSDSLGEAVYKSSTAVSQSLVYTGIYIANPAAGLVVTGVGSYGSDRVYQNQRIKEITEKQKMGYLLSPAEQKIITRSGAVSRLNSLTKAGVEVGFTSLFTYRYFKGVKNAKKGFKGPMTSENSRKISDAYAKNVRQTIAGKISKYLGVDKKAILAEIPEENLIVLTNYMFDVEFGIDTWDWDRAKRMVGETTLVAFLSATSTGMAVKGYQNTQIKRIGEQRIKNNINLPAESKSIVTKLNVDAEVRGMEKDAEQGLISLENNDNYQSLKDLQTETDSQIQKFEDMKTDLVDRMTVNDKAIFLDLLTKIEQQDAKITSTRTKNATKRKSEENIKDYKKKARKILSKYPSDMSFYFADSQVQSEYFEKAVAVISQERLDKGEKDFTIDNNDPAVFNRAAQLHTKAVADGIVEARQNANAASYIGLNRASDNFSKIDRKELDKWNLSNDISTVEDLLSQPKLDLKDAKPIEDVNKGEDEGTTIKDTEDGSVVVGTTKTNIDILAEIKAEKTASIVSRIKQFNLDSDFKNDLPIEQYEVMKDFFDKVKLGKKVPFGKIESILDAHDIALQISSNATSKINVGASLKGVYNEDGSFTEKGIKLYNSLAQITAAKLKFNTMTMEGLTLIRDTDIGKPLHNLIQEVLRSTSESQQVVGAHKTNLELSYKNDVIAYNKANGTNYDPNPTKSLESSYEMSIISMLKRKIGEKNKDGQDLEFVRAKSLILQELEQRKKDAEASTTTLKTINGDKKSAKRKYEQYRDVVERLGVVDANSFDDISPNALPFNLAAINNLAAVMPGQRAIDRINDYENHTAVEFEDGSYTPLFMQKVEGGTGFNDYFGPENNDGMSTNSGMKVTRPNDLGGDLRLSPGNYWNMALGQLNGMEMEIAGKKNIQTLDNLLYNPTFLNTFEDGDLKDILIDNFKNRSKIWQQEVRSNNLKAFDVGDTKKRDTAKKFMNVMYGAVSAVSLARVTQPASQFFSAVSGTYPILKNDVAKDYVQMRGASFFVGMAGSFNLSGTPIGNHKGFGYFNSQGKLGNIYQKSRTGFRNALSSQLAIDPNQAMPTDYYVSNLNLNDAQSKVLKNLGVQLTLDRVLETLAKSNEVALNFMLANSDKAAAGIAFEAHYLDYKMSEGENVTDLDAFWIKENENPDLDAIRYADQIIDRTMRQSDRTGEAQIYSNEYTKEAMRQLMPFQKFIMNAKADFSVQLSILQDPNISELQKQDARRFMQGKFNEIVSFNAIKYAGSIATLTGMAGLLSLGLDVDEDDVFELGGMEGKISKDLGIKSTKDDIDALETSVAGATSIEERNAAESALAGFREADDVIRGFEQWAMNYDKKFSTGQNYGIVGSTIQDAIQTLDPFVKIGVMNDAMAYTVNQIYGEDIAREYSSRGLTSEPLTTDSAAMMILRKLGMAGIAYETGSRLVTAYQVRADGTFTIDQGDYKNKKVYLTAPNDAMRRKVANQVDFLYQLRIHSIMNPFAPRADLDKYADRLERTIEKYFTQSTPDQAMLRLMGIEGPVEEEN